MKKYAGLIIRVVVSTAMLLVLLAVVDREALVQSLRSVRPEFYLLAVLSFLGAPVFWTLRWYLFLRAVGENISYWRALRTLLVGLFYSMFLPTLVGADVGRMYELSRDPLNNRTNVISTVMLERLVAMLSLALLALLSLLLGYQFVANTNVALPVIGAVALFGGGWIIFFNQRLAEFVFGIAFKLPVINRLETKVRELYEVLHNLQTQPRLLLSAFLASLINNIAAVFAAWFAARAIGVELDILYFFVFMPIIWLVALIPISISGLGLREGAIAVFFGTVGVSSADAVAIGLLIYSFDLIAGAAGGLLLLHSTLMEFQRKSVSSPESPTEIPG